MKPASSLFAKILAWFFLNIILVAAVLALFFTFQSKIDLYAIFGQEGTSRLRTAGLLIAQELARIPKTDWADILARHATAHRVTFTLVLENGMHYSSSDSDLPGKVMAAVRDAMRHEASNRLFSPPHPHGGHPDDWKRTTADGAGGRSDRRRIKKPPFPPPARWVREPPLIMRTNNPTRYWAGIRIPLPAVPPGPPPAAFLFAVSDSLTGDGFFFDPIPWIVATVAVILISVLFWIPMVRSITRPLTRMTRATGKMARGRFDVLLHEPRADEIGRLAKTINHMAARLSALVTGQKRFLSDVAHELGSPIARIQFGLGALEQRVHKENRQRVADVLEDVDHMTKLVNELLAFSRADLKADTVTLKRIDLLSVVETAVRREAKPDARIDVEIDPAIQVVASAELLNRAIANLVWNAVKYAGDAGPISVTAKRRNRLVEIEVRDSGPGVPEDLLGQLFEPFFRPEASRDGDSGGVGLGLSIVKTCVETCRGTVSAANLKPGGFSVTITLPS